MFLNPIASTFASSCELVGLCDNSETRRTYHQKRLVSEYGLELIPTFGDFDQMLRETKPDVVIVCTPDYLHHEYIIKSLQAGADVISEKPLTTDSEKSQAIDEAVKASGRSVRVTFNMRWTPAATKIREILEAGTIGRVRHVDFEYTLNTSHGADYFRRWHSQKEFSGGLLIHKSTHHFDLINWWLDAIPAEVFAYGDLVYYGQKNAIERGDEKWTKYPRYTGHPEADNDPFCFPLDKEGSSVNGLYYQAEEETGYIRDQNVFREGIDIEDSMSLLIKYRTGQVVAYSLNAYSPDEGFRVSISGDGGRMEFVQKHSSHIVTGDSDAKSTAVARSSSLKVQKLFSEAYEVEIPVAPGGHFGADPLIQEQMFADAPPEDLWFRNAGHEQGIASLLIGAAANQSIATGQPINLDNLYPLNPEARQLRDLV